MWSGGGVQVVCIWWRGLCVCALACALGRGVGASRAVMHASSDAKASPASSLTHLTSHCHDSGALDVSSFSSFKSVQVGTASAVARASLLASLKGIGWSKKTSSGLRTKRLDRLERLDSGLCGRRGAASRKVTYLP